MTARLAPNAVGGASCSRTRLRAARCTETIGKGCRSIDRRGDGASRQRFAGEAGDHVGDRPGGCAGADHDDRKPQGSCIDETAAAVIIEQALGNGLGGAVRGLRRLHLIIRHDRRQLTAEDCNRACIDELRPLCAQAQEFEHA